MSQDVLSNMAWHGWQEKDQYEVRGIYAAWWLSTTQDGMPERVAHEALRTGAVELCASNNHGIR